MSNHKDDFLRRAAKLMKPQLVLIDNDAIASMAVGELPDAGGQAPLFPTEAQSPLDIIRFALLLNSINHQFWDIVDGQFQRYSHQGKVGAIAMIDGLRSLVSAAGSLAALEGAGPLSPADVERFFGAIPDPAGRARALNEALGPKGRAAATLLLDATVDEGVWGIAHAQAISTLLPLGFEDPFLKKSQLCLWISKGMLLAAGHRPPRADLTCFADYQVPKVLRSMGVLVYGKRLAAKVDAGCLLAQDGPEETAIRSSTIIACERLAASLGTSAPQLDLWLWLRRNDHPQLFHRVKTRRY